MHAINGANGPERPDSPDGSKVTEGKLMENATVKQAEGEEAKGPLTTQKEKPEEPEEREAVLQTMRTNGSAEFTQVKAGASLQVVQDDPSESVKDDLKSNPLLSLNDFPLFSKIRPEHAIPAVEKTIADFRAVVEDIVKIQDPCWSNVCGPLEECMDRLNQVSHPVIYMTSVLDNPEIRLANEACLLLISDHEIWVGQHKPLYEAYKAIQAREDFSTLDQAKQQAVNNFLRDAKLKGIDLAPEEQVRFTEISRRLTEISSKFSSNVLDATMGWSKHILDKNLLSGLPESALEAAKEKAVAAKKEGYFFSLEYPSFISVMTYCDNRKLRAEIYEAYVTRASDMGPNANKWDNTKLMNEALLLKHESACLLGFANYAEQSLATKMADSTESVFKFLNELVDKTKPQGCAEFESLKEFSKEKLSIENMEAWDVPYCTEKLKQAKFQISGEDLRPYFPEEKVVSGLFEVVKRLYGITVRPRDNVDVWHDAVTCYDVFDKEGVLRGTCFFDLYARENKNGGAWMNNARDRRMTESGELQTPVAYVTGNFNKPSKDKPALFTHNEVTTLFHEFGHALHQILTKVDVSSVSGTNGVNWDAVELPSQFSENWAWQKDALSFISGHYETGEPLPEDMLDKMLAAKNFQSAMRILRQLEFGVFDFTLFAKFDPEEGPKVLETLADVKKKVAVIPTPEWNRFSHAFSHIFSGGYSAGYYGYLWSEVLSADAFGRFKEEGIFNSDTGASFLKCILERGGSENAMNLFKEFRGRDPSPDALLEDNGVIAKSDQIVSKRSPLRFWSL